MVRNNHRRTDLDHYEIGDHNCLSYPFDDKLGEGVNTRQTDVRGAGSLSTAMQLVAVNFQLQSLQQFGGVSATHLDWTMVPYVRLSFFQHFITGLKYVERMSYEEAVEAIKGIFGELDEQMMKKLNKLYNIEDGN